MKFKSFTEQSRNNNSGLKCSRPLFVQAGNEVHVGQKQKGRTQIAFSFSLHCGLSLILYLAHTLKDRQRRHPAGPRFILAGELRANPVRWLSQSTDKQRENLVMHQRLTMSQVAGTLAGASRPIHITAEYTPTDKYRYITSCCIQLQWIRMFCNSLTY